jgi:U3 small nucleolar RNA-associated protein 3
MGKGRSTAKTGSGRGSKREEASGSSSKRAEPAEEDQDYMRLEENVERRSKEDEEDIGLPSQYQEVMDLGAGDDSDDEDSSEEEDNQDEKDHANPQDDLRSDEDEDDEDSESGEEDEVTDPRNWGRKKSAYYNGDTADLEIGQDEEVRRLLPFPYYNPTTEI